MLQARLRRVVEPLSELRIWLMDADLVSWKRLIGPKVVATEELYGHLVALPTEEPATRTIEEYDDAEQAKAETAARLHTYFHRLRIQHPFTRDVTTLCGWWRLDAVNSPNYEDFRKTSLGKDASEKSSEIRISEEFLARTRTFDMSAATRDFSGLEDRGGSYNRALDLLREESRQAMVYASTQRRMLREYHITSLFTKSSAAVALHNRMVVESDRQAQETQRQLEETYADLPIDSDDIEDSSDVGEGLGETAEDEEIDALPDLFPKPT